MTELGVTIREIRPEELAVTIDLRHAMNMEIDGSDYDQLHPGWRDRYVAFFEGLLRNKQGQFFVAESGNELVGTIAVYNPVTHRSAISLKQSAYVCTVYVNPQWRHRGIARALTLRAVDWAKQNGCEVVRLRSSPMGRPVYEGLGFRQSEELELRI